MTRQTNPEAIASLVLGLMWLLWIGSIAALVLGYSSLRQIRRSNGAEDGREFAIAGIVLGWIGVGILAVILAVVGVVAIADDDDDDDVGQQRTATTLDVGGGSASGAPDPAPPPADTPADALESTVMVDGAGEPAGDGDTVRVHYVGKLPDGTVFDSSWDREPFPVTLGAGQVIAGWEEGLVGAQVGERRRLVIGSDLAYGPEGSGPIPPGTPLAFEIDVVEITAAP
jgi:peptidylprolyl isomerase